MKLDAWLARIEKLHPAEIELGLARINLVADRLQLLPLAGNVIVVAGTNGKGSTVALLDQLARAAGFSTAVYTSPHLLRFNERVRVNGKLADDDSLCQAFAAIDQAREDIALTYFEYTTLAALIIFQQHQPDLTILEVGLGGRLDAVNIVDADVSIITSIGLDHTDWLGDTLEAIAVEKAGVRRANKPLLFAGDEMPAVIAELCSQDKVPLMRAGEQFGWHSGHLFWQHGDASARAQVECEAPVWLGEDNLASAVQALALLGLLNEDVISTVAGNARVPGRSQHLQIDGITWVFDVGHNAEALSRFVERLPKISSKTVALVGMLADKPAQRALAPFVSLVSHWYLAALSGTRGQSAAQLRKALPDGPSARVDEFADVASAVSALRERLDQQDRVLVVGSFHTVAEAATALSISLE